MRLRPVLAPMALYSCFLWWWLWFLGAIFIPHAITCVDLDGLSSGARGKHEAPCGNDIAVSPVTAKKKMIQQNLNVLEADFVQSFFLEL